MAEETPPLEWLVENFVHEGKVKFCTDCGIVPAVPMGPVHACYGMSGAEATLGGLGGEWAEETADTARLHAIQNEDRPGGWYCYYEPAPHIPNDVEVEDG